MINHALAQVDHDNAEKLRAFIEDTDIPEAFRVWAEYAVLVFRREAKDCGELMAMSLTWRVLRYAIADASERDLMDAKGEVLRAAREWKLTEKANKRARDRFNELGKDVNG